MTRGEIWWADFEIPFGSEPGFKRPILVVQDDAFNRSNIATIVVLPLSTNLLLAQAPGNVFFKKGKTGLPKDSVLVTSHIHSIDRARLSDRIGKIAESAFEEVEEGLLLVLGIQGFR